MSGINKGDPKKTFYLIKQQQTKEKKSQSRLSNTCETSPLIEEARLKNASQQKYKGNHL